MASAVFTGRVLFSMTILEDSENARICRAVFSQYWRSAAIPAPRPNDLVGVFTLTKMMSFSRIPVSISVLKKRFFPRVALTIVSRPGSKMGSSSEFHAAIRSGLMSTTVTR